MNKAILGVSVLAIGIGTYFYLSGSEEVKIVKQEISEKIEPNETMVGKQKDLKKKEVKKKTGVEVVKGYKLPPEPDKTLNNSTLLGIDINNNMLRDDVERWVVNRPWSSQRIAAGLQRMRGLQIIIDDSFGSYKRRFNLGSMTKHVYRAVFSSDLGTMIDENKQFRRIIFNTPERRKAYKEYDYSFSGTIVKAFPGSGKFSYKYADYTMENGTLSSYEFNSEIYSKEKIPLYNPSNGLISTRYWSLEENKKIRYEGDREDKFCELNFGIPKNNIECARAKRKARKSHK